MKLHVHVHNQPVATLESTDGFRHVMTYHPDVQPEQFVSLLMPVRTESYTYPELHPLFRMNLPEGFLLSILQEQLGPHVGASPLNMLSVVGRNAIGRVKVATPGADPTQPPVPFDLNGILRGDNSEEAFVDLVRRHAASGVSGVVPKFLSPNTFGEHTKGTLATERYIIKGTTARLPGVALNIWHEQVSPPTSRADIVPHSSAKSCRCGRNMRQTAGRGTKRMSGRSRS